MAPVTGSRLRPSSPSAIRESLDAAALQAEQRAIVPPETGGVFGITGAELAVIVSQAIQDVVASLEDGLSIGEVIAVFAISSQRLAGAAEGAAVPVLNTVASVLFALSSMWGYSAKRDARGRFRKA